ncbi:beta-galactosidase [Nocardia sp. CDC159]|uniref:Beta-galactosidase n=1 Tax=Nocardia pulmonis TaxID=2951408 RepID=A0A9X2EE24_9NOCA|nr:MULTISPECIES: beta-galactosidase [Nocardia]MCM6776548.1 beta-galactosidase [Nocardia pulmonis]MCM6788972.1 beta-galactosidase [Nocardia sp. CDC159]
MERRRFLKVGALSPIAAMALTGTASSSPASAAAGRSFGFAPDGSAFLLDGKPFQIRSGEMHPARIPVRYWRHRIRMAKAMGMNTIALYVMWNYVEERPGVFDFTTDRRDIEAFVRLCQAEDMWVLLRPGPYVCGEWDLGGLPAYLLSNPDIQLRVNAFRDPRYMSAVRRYIDRLIPRVEPLLIGNGGPILMIQIENEYGSYGNDAQYLTQLRQLWIDGGITGPFYTEDGLDQVRTNRTIVPGGAIALSGGNAAAIAQARKEFPDVPTMAGEVYPGWLTHWGDPAFQGGDVDISADLKAFMDQGLSFNIYVIHGGTNFGFYAGANADNRSGHYQPDITSYDYSAPITEQGAATRRYHAYRALLGGYLATSLPDIPAPVPTLAGVRFTPTAFTSVWDNLPAPFPPERTVDPAPFEMYGQNFGFALYRRPLRGYTGGKLDIRWVHDYATVFLNNTYAGGISRPAVPDAVSKALHVTNNAPLDLPNSAVVGAEPVLDILVEGMGRTNYGHALVDRKGILRTVSLRDAGPLTGDLTGWQVFGLPMDEAYVAALKPRLADPARPGVFFEANLTLTAVADTYLDMSGWTKGFVYVNGHNLGRYWQIGPQQRLYCPAPWLRRGANRIVVFDLHQTQARPITFERTLA